MPIVTNVINDALLLTDDGAPEKMERIGHRE